LELAAGGSSLVLGVPGYLLNQPVLEFFAVLFALVAFVLVIARLLLDPPTGGGRKSAGGQ
jgi:hypothetical protein